MFLLTDLIICLDVFISDIICLSKVKSRDWGCQSWGGGTTERASKVFKETLREMTKTTNVSWKHAIQENIWWWQQESNCTFLWGENQIGGLSMWRREECRAKDEVKFGFIKEFWANVKADFISFS